MAGNDFKAKACAERAARAAKRKGETWVTTPPPPPVKLVKPKTDYEIFEENILKKAPKLSTYKKALQKLFGLSHIRDVKDWEPDGKGANTIFISLVSFLLAKYPMPKFIWSVFFEDDPNCTVTEFRKDPNTFGGNKSSRRIQTNRMIDFLQFVAAGESAYKVCQGGILPVPLNRKQCHELMNSTSDCTFMYALRKVQVKTHGGSPRLLRAWMDTRYGQNLCCTREQEVFWDSVLAWFAKNPMLDIKQIGPITDYISYLFNQDNDFSMKGRSVLAVMRGMEEWHGELNRSKEFRAKNFLPCGFKMGVYQIKNLSGEVQHEWTINEILTSAELSAEGSAMHHCVYSYSHAIVSGDTSIWSMKYNGDRLVTIEVWNKTKQIRQVRGKYNRLADGSEVTILKKWAGENNLAIDISSW
jgi:hypothetical protein